ncbi:hypothetical protein DAHU10_018950, partial [Hanseniaspora uvarum]
MIVMHNL